MGFVAVIPARAGSKRVPGKNFRMLADKPLIVWTVEAALNTELFQKIIIATDSTKVLEVCKPYDVEIVIRPPQTAEDDSTPDQLLEFLHPWFKEYTDLCYLQPTSPLRNYHHIQAAYDIFKSEESNSLISVTETRLTSDHCYIHLNESISPLNKQLLKPSINSPLLFPNGAIYISKVQSLVDRGFDLNKDIESFYIMTEFDSVDIDFESDFILASLALGSDKKY